MTIVGIPIKHNDNPKICHFSKKAVYRGWRVLLSKI